MDSSIITHRRPVHLLPSCSGLGTLPPSISCCLVQPFHLRGLASSLHRKGPLRPISESLVSLLTIVVACDDRESSVSHIINILDPPAFSTIDETVRDIFPFMKWPRLPRVHPQSTSLSSSQFAKSSSTFHLESFTSRILPLIQATCLHLPMQWKTTQGSGPHSSPMIS